MTTAAEEIKKKLDIVEFIGSYITLKKAGRNFKANCPFHNEKSPSFVVSPDREIWHCFGSCHEGGDVIKFFMKWENITFNEALKELAQKTGVVIERTDIEDSALRKKSRLFQMNKLAAQYYRYVLTSTQVGAKAREYLKERGINEKVAGTFGIGYSPQSWDSLMQFLLNKKFTKEEMREAGLMVVNSRGNTFDWFRGRLVFPIHDTRGNIVGFSGRSLNPEEKMGKYINSPETLLYHKRETLYGMYLAKDAIKKEDAVILVEGEFDVITPFQHGVENIVAVKGSAITREQLQLIKRYGNKLIFALDADASGEDAIKRGAKEAEEMDFEILVMTLDFAKDPDEAVRKDLPAFKKALRNAVPIYDFLYDSLAKKYSVTDPFGKKKIVDELVVYLQRIPNPIVQSHYVKKFAQSLEVSEESLVKSISTQRRRQGARRFLPATPHKHEEERHIMIQKYTLSLMLQNKPDLPLGEVFETLTRNDFSVPSLGLLYQSMSDFYQKNHVINENLPVTLPSELIPLYDELLLLATYDESHIPHSILRLAYEVRENSIKRDLKALASEEKEFNDHEQERIRGLQKELKEVEKKLANV